MHLVNKMTDANGCWKESTFIDHLTGLGRPPIWPIGQAGPVTKHKPISILSTKHMINSYIRIS